MSVCVHFPRPIPRPALSAAPLAALLTSGLFVALCAVALALETSIVAGVPPQRYGFYSFVFFATWSSYRLHALARHGAVGAAAMSLLLVATIVSALSLRTAMLPWVVLAALLSISYSMPALPRGRRIRDYGVPKILVLAGVWTLVTAYLPAQKFIGDGAMLFLLARRFVFMFALCLAFDVRDRESDARAGIRTLAVRLGIANSYTMMRASLLGFALLILAAPFIGSVAHPAMLVSAALLGSALATWVVIERSRAAVSSLFHLGWVDGMMLAQGALVAVAAWIAHAR